MTDPVAVGRYAGALFEAAREAGQTAQVDADMEVLSSGGPVKELIRVLLNPRYSAAQKRGVIDALGKALSSATSAHFLFVLLRKNRTAILPEIARNFRELYKTSQGVVACEVTLAAEPEAGFKARILTALKRITHTEVEMTVRVVPGVIGGVAVRIRNKILDATFRSRIDQLKKRLLEVKIS